MNNVTIHLHKPSKGTTIIYHGALERAAHGYALVHARWERPRLDLGYVVFETGDHFYEHYYADRWYNVFEVRGQGGALKGWYCNVTRPAVLSDGVIESEDLELDVFVSADRQMILTLDEDEFEERGLQESEPAAYAAALAALDELHTLARAGQPPFEGGATIR